MVGVRRLVLFTCDLPLPPSILAWHCIDHGLARGNGACIVGAVCSMVRRTDYGAVCRKASTGRVTYAADLVPCAAETPGRCCVVGLAACG